MPPFPLNLGLGSTVGRESQATSIRHINCYVEETGEDGKSNYALYSAPGLERWDNGAYTGIGRGLIELNDSQLIAFLGNEVVQLDTAGGATTLDTLVGSGRLPLARNRKLTPQIAIITSAGQYYVLESGVMTLVADPDLPAPNFVTYVKGFFVFSIADGRIFASDLDEGTAINAASFDTANSNSDGNVAVFEHAGFLYVFGRKSTEIWQADPALAASPFIFSPVQQNIALGCSAPHSIAQVGLGLMWVDNDGIVRYGRDGGAIRISTHTVERAIEDLTIVEREAIGGRQWFFQGHEIYTLFSDHWTWNYDLTTQRWNERMSYGDTKWIANDIISFANQYIASSATDGKLFRVNSDVHTEDSNEFVMEVHCPIAHHFPGSMICDSFEMDGGKGLGLNSATLSLSNPEWIIDYSDDGAKTFGGERRASMGQLGKFKEKVRLNKWGRIDEDGRIWRIRANAPVLRSVWRASMEGRLIR